MEPKCLRACADAGHTCTHLHAYDCADAGHTHTHLHTRDCAGAGHTCDWPGETSRGHPTPGALEAIWPPSPSRPLPSSEGASTLIGQVLSGEALGVAYGKLFYAVIHPTPPQLSQPDVGVGGQGGRERPTTFSGQPLTPDTLPPPVVGLLCIHPQRCSWD